MLRVQELTNEIPALAGVGEQPRQPCWSHTNVCGERSRMVLSRVGIRNTTELC